MIDSFVIFANQISRYIIPFLLVSIPFYGLFIKKIKVAEENMASDEERKEALKLMKKGKK